MNVCQYCETPMTRDRPRPEGVVRACTKTACVTCYKRLNKNGSLHGTSLSKDFFIHEHNFFVWYGLGFDEIAKKLGLREDAYAARIGRYGLTYRDRDTDKCWEWVRKYSVRGIEFTTDSLPSVDRPHRTHQFVVHRAIRDGLIKDTGRVKKSVWDGEIVRVYQGVG